MIVRLQLLECIIFTSFCATNMLKYYNRMTTIFYTYQSQQFNYVNKITKIICPHCRLHMLNELEQCFLTLMDFPSKSTRGQLGAVGASSPVGDVTVSTEGPSIEFASLVQQWHSRLKFSQVLNTSLI